MTEIFIVASMIASLALILGVQRLMVTLVERDTQKIRAKVWDEGYRQGVEDERQAAAVDIPEYRIPNRQNPYRASKRSR